MPVPVIAISLEDRRIFEETYFSARAQSEAQAADQGSADWLRARGPLVTASIVGAVCGQSPYAIARSIVVDKVALIEKGIKQVPTVHMRYGSLMERAVFEQLARQLNVNVVSSRMIVLGSCAYSPDGFVRRGGHCVAAIEIKVASPFAPGYAFRKFTTIPRPHLFQMLFGAAICARTGRALEYVLYAFYLKGVLHVATLPLAGDAGKPFRALRDALLLAMQNFSRDVLVPALASRDAPDRVRNVVVHVPAAVDEAVARACAAATHTTVLLVEPAEVVALRAELSQPGARVFTQPRRAST